MRSQMPVNQGRNDTFEMRSGFAIHAQLKPTVHGLRHREIGKTRMCSLIKICMITTLIKM